MVSVFSFCLYGPYNARYYPGMIENIDLVAKYFPDWKVYIYVSPDVEQSMLDTLATYPNVVLRPTNVEGAPNMVHRFFAIDEPGVDLMMVRDADSRIHWKERWAIRDFLQYPQFIAHAIRDNPEHKADLLGGLWGIRKRAGLTLREEYARYDESAYEVKPNRHLEHDQSFLANAIYPKIAPGLLVHHSCDRFLKSEYGIEFPFDWDRDLYCGYVELGTFTDPPEPEKTPRIATTVLGQFIVPRRNTVARSHPAPNAERLAGSFSIGKVVSAPGLSSILRQTG